MALLLLLLPALLSAGEHLAAGVGSISSTMPQVKVTAAVDGFVTGVNGTVVTLQSSSALQVDLSNTKIIWTDGAPSTTPPSITPGSHLAATVEEPTGGTAGSPPPPLIAIQAIIRPADSAFLGGEVDSVAADSFSLLLRPILVDSNTVFDGRGEHGALKGLSDLSPGVQVAVWLTVTGDTLLARKVLGFGPTVTPRPISFRGVVKAIGADSWTINDITVGVTADTKIVGDPMVGDTVDVVANVVDPPNPMMGMPSRLVAVSIVKVVLPPSPEPGRTVTFTGLVQAMPRSGTMGLWRIADRDVVVNGLTKISGNPKVGDTVEVTGFAAPAPPGLGSPTAATGVVVATSITKI